jgi:acyl-CoA thioesterase
MNEEANWKQRLSKANLHPFHKLLNIEIVTLGDGHAVVHSMPEAKYENVMGRMHGGYIASILDAVMGSAVATKVPGGLSFGTVDLNAKYVRKIEVATGKLIATANVIHAGRSLLTVEARVADEAGKLYAHGSGTFMVYPKQ